ncbi:fumarylacetoacetate hydrolase family protein [Sphingomonas sp.]|uniref:fumarylacetoacetate hydrolase family protein n=1 Tax=Sphingomonas sp. TaxID=28214 RepID=UPI0017A56724|nr:fumarylacetoacetate hydrolase family protein [Sphingomonas sp.]MBA4761821.1 fumarylacetoacetate hydrolase family protein [Sphingomonas sp.]
MALQVVRFEQDGNWAWGVHHAGRIAPIGDRWKTTGAFLSEGGPEAAAATNPAGAIPLEAVHLLSPVTADRDYICQATNYGSHLREIGRDPKDQVHNVIFHKASSCLSGPQDDVIKPSHVQLLDYEVELGLVVGAAVAGAIDPTPQTLHRWIGALVVTNDISARDVQVSHEQFCKAKSYRTFGPTGPFLLLPEPGELARWGELVLTLSVNGSERQRAPASDMIFDPVATLAELSRIRDLRPGDLIATGTPSGVALKVPSAPLMFIGKFLSPAARYKAFVRGQLKNPAYLKDGDVIECGIATPDGTIDLGRQRTRVRAA